MKALLILASAAVLTIAGCSSDSDSDAETSPTATATATSSPSPTKTKTENCSEDSILDALPNSSEMVRYECADVDGTEWAAAEVNPGPTVFFLQRSGDSWDVSTSDEICGTASAGLPESLLAFCADDAGNSSPSETDDSDS